MKLAWQELTKLTGGEEISIERVKIDQTGIRIEGSFELPPLARLKLEDQVFVMAFVKSHGSIKEMEKLFGVSYPTIKSRLNRIAGSFDLLSVEAPPTTNEILSRLERGELTTAEALKLLKNQ